MGQCLSNCFKKKRQESVHNEVVQNVMYCKTGRTGSRMVATARGDSIQISGTGIFLGSYMLDCDSAYWEVRVKENPKGVRIGLMRYNDKVSVSLEGSLVADPENCWVLNHNNIDLRTDDIIGVCWDQTDFPMLGMMALLPIHIL